MLSFLSQPMIGLDIRASGMYLLQLRATRKGFLAECAGFAALPDAVFSEGQITQWDILQTHLADMVRQLGIANRATALHLPANLVRMQQMQLPRGADIAEEISMQLARDFKGFDETLAMDFAVSSEKSANFLQVHYAVTRKEYVANLIQCVENAGLKVKVVDMDLLALQRCFHAGTAGEDKNLIHAVACLVHDVLLFMVFSSQEILFHYEEKLETLAAWQAVLEQQIAIFLTGSQEIHAGKLLLYSEQPEAIQINAGAFSVELFNPFAAIQLSASMQNLREKMSGYVLALGLAMRECPRW